MNNAIIVDDDDNEIIVEPKSSTKNTHLSKYYVADPNIIEIGIDEVARGPLFGKTFSAAVVLPRDDSFNHSLMKDSKRFTSTAKINQAAEYIRQHALAWAVCYEDETVIDRINILQASQRAMHRAIAEVYTRLDPEKEISLLVDGDYFNPYRHKNLVPVQHYTFKGGDNKYTSIAAASILAKAEHCKYIAELCAEFPELIEKYDINNNKGYGTKKHLDGIRMHGISQWHRKSFGICKSYACS